MPNTEHNHIARLQQEGRARTDRPISGSSFGVNVTPIPPRVVRCACEQCGAHTNAVSSFRVGGSCPTCGSFRLVPIQGAELMLGASSLVA
jgi:Zn finger protein HypA/HybF involved in hydrogenase expression